MIIDEPRASFACILRAALPVMAPLVTLAESCCLCFPSYETKSSLPPVVLSPYAQVVGGHAQPRAGSRRSEPALL